MQEFKHKGYTLIQETEVNHHYSIYDPNGNYVFRASYEGDLLTKTEAKKHIENYIKLKKEI